MGMCFMAQPRVFYAVAKDGLMPRRFLSVDERGNPRCATIVTGILLIACGALLPFDALANAISGGVLVAFTLVNCCVITLRVQPSHGEQNHSRSIGVALAVFAFSCTASAFLAKHIDVTTSAGLAYTCSSAVLALVALAAVFVVTCQHKERECSNGDAFFRVPCTPWIPLLAIVFNSIMLASLELRDFALLVGYMVLVLTPYLFFVFQRRPQQTVGVSLS